MNVNFKQMGLVLEGGGMRGAFTCGVLDYMMDMGIEFPYVIGVSAGACHALSFLSHQRGRARFSAIDMYQKYHYIGMRYWWKQGSIIDRNLLYHRFQDELYPFDYETYQRNPARFEIVTTNCQTGQPCYLEEKRDMERLRGMLKASSSLPFVCPITYVDGIPMLDGGITDSIPLMRAIQNGYEFNVVVSTRHRGFRKAEESFFLTSLIYRRYPRLYRSIQQNIPAYNKQLELVEQMEDMEKILLIRPMKTVDLGVLEGCVPALISLYDEGYANAEKMLSPHLAGIENIRKLNNKIRIL